MQWCVRALRRHIGRLFICSRRWIARINQWGPAFSIRNARLSTAHDNEQRRCILCAQLSTQDARDPDWFSNQGNLCTRLLSPRVNATPSKGGRCVFFLSNRSHRIFLYPIANFINSRHSFFSLPSLKIL